MKMNNLLTDKDETVSVTYVDILTNEESTEGRTYKVLINIGITKKMIFTIYRSKLGYLLRIEDMGNLTITGGKSQ